MAARHGRPAVGYWLVTDATAMIANISTSTPAMMRFRVLGSTRRG